MQYWININMFYPKAVVQFCKENRTIFLLLEVTEEIAKTSPPPPVGEPILPL